MFSLRKKYLLINIVGNLRYLDILESDHKPKSPKFLHVRYPHFVTIFSRASIYEASVNIISKINSVPQSESLCSDYHQLHPKAVP